ncbi:MAG TPA: Uma2 family endonuclease [Polyangiaceae bacterium]|nr:Uma2 family endonuclease [Polyangiaceae bacterium]
MAQAAPSLLTAAEYLALERSSPTKHELFQGQLIAMTGASLVHNVIVANIVAELRAALRDRPCVALPSDMKVLVRASGHYYYPDATIVCGAPEFADDQRDAIVNPTVVVEVLSDSTERRDRGDKFHDYRSIPSCTDYLMCSSAEPFVEHYTRDADGWRLREYGSGEVVSLRGVEIRLSIAEVYVKAFGAQ